MKTNKINDDLDYSRMLSDIENIVSSLKDEKLKIVAFEKLLEMKLNSSLILKSDSTKAKKHLSHNLINDSRKSSGPLQWLKEMGEDNFFVEPKTSNEILEELGNRSHHLKLSDITRQLERLCHERILRRKKESISKGKDRYRWVNW